jgi:Sec-independent protein secretion pathway component TatC
LAFGAIFELPLILLILGRIGVVSYHGLARNRRYALLLNTVASAILTPTPDAYTMLLMMAPIQVLYEASIWLVRIRQEEAGAEEADERSDSVRTGREEVQCALVTIAVASRRKEGSAGAEISAPSTRCFTPRYPAT